MVLKLEPKFGFKNISKDNWLEPDVPKFFPQFSEQYWVDSHLAPTLNSEVPEDIHKLFEVTRGSMIYGWFFYPLMTLATEQFFRILELAITKRCEQLGISIKIVLKGGRQRYKTFSELIKELVSIGEISSIDRTLWENIPGARNVVSHPKRQAILLPGDTLTTLKRSAELINKLFVLKDNNKV